MMKVKEILILLKTFDPEAEVFIEDCGNPVSVHGIAFKKTVLGTKSKSNPVILGDSIAT